MAQTEDAELRDLVIDALEKNGSLAKIRALLRANIFLAFEDECENIRQNVSLDNLLKLPEGVLALSIVHEFLECCNLKNTLFVYKSESRQGKDYNNYGKKISTDKLGIGKHDPKEPILLTLIKNLSKLNNSSKHQRVMNQHGDSGDNNYKDEQNSSYIVHEDSQSSGTNTSQSDNSLDEKNKLHLRLHMDNSDTDTSTSTDSTRDKTSSEYIPSDHILEASNSHKKDLAPKSHESNLVRSEENALPLFSKLPGNNSSDSTSYADLKPFSSYDEKAHNTMGIPFTDYGNIPQLQHLSNIPNEPHPKDSAKSTTLSSVSSLSFKNESIKNDYEIKSSRGSSKSDGETVDYTFDFTSQGSKNRVSPDKPKTLDEKKHVGNKSSPVASPHQNSQSSVSISDVADLISEKSSSFNQHSHNEKSLEREKSLSSNYSKNTENILNKHSDDSGDFSESPIPSLSNLSLDIHSD